MSDESFGESLGNAIGAMLTRSMVEDHFSGHFEFGAVLRATTASGSKYHIELTPNGEPEEFDHTDEAMGAIFWIRPGSVNNRGENFTGWVGYNMQYGVFLVLDEGKKFIRRSSSVATVEEMSFVTGR